MRFPVSTLLAVTLATSPLVEAEKVTISYQTELSAVAHSSECMF